MELTKYNAASDAHQNKVLFYFRVYNIEGSYCSIFAEKPSKMISNKLGGRTFNFHRVLRNGNAGIPIIPFAGLRIFTDLKECERAFMDSYERLVEECHNDVENQGKVLEDYKNKINKYKDTYDDF